MLPDEAALHIRDTAEELYAALYPADGSDAGTSGLRTGTVEADGRVLGLLVDAEELLGPNVGAYGSSPRLER